MSRQSLKKEIILSRNELQEAASVARQRMDGVEDLGLKDKHGAEVDRNFQYHLLGAKGEIAFKKFMNSNEKLSVNTFKKIPDISGFEVRTRSQEDYDLIIRKDDPDDRIYVLIVGEGCRFKIIGWIKGCEKYNFQPKTFNGRPKAWFIPQCALHQIEDAI